MQTKKKNNHIHRDSKTQMARSLARGQLEAKNVKNGPTYQNSKCHRAKPCIRQRHWWSPDTKRIQQVQWELMCDQVLSMNIWPKQKVHWLHRRWSPRDSRTRRWGCVHRQRQHTRHKRLNKPASSHLCKAAQTTIRWTNCKASRVTSSSNSTQQWTQ